MHCKVPLDRESGRLADGKETMAGTILLSSDFTFHEGTVNANGIEVQSKTFPFMVSLDGVFSHRELERLFLH